MTLNFKKYLAEATYEFSVGQRVRSVRDWTKVGEINSMVPGNGSIPWYYVTWEDGTEDRYTAEELETV
jgi:hypothetical protein